MVSKGGYLCIVYVSEGVRSAVISRLQHIAATSSPLTLCAHSFVDEPYNRTSFYLLSRSRRALISAALAVSRSAFEAVDFRLHRGTHPTLGAVDHVCFSPLGSGSVGDSSGPIDQAAAAALGRDFGRALHEQEAVSVYFYGAASAGAEQGAPRALKDVRRELGYFEQGGIAGAERADALWALMANAAPDLGGGGAGEDASGFVRRGLTCVGVVPLVRNFNVRFGPGAAKPLVAQVTRHLREPGCVEALTLPWRDRFEVACNLRSHAPEHSPEALLHRAVELSAPLGLSIEEHYCTGPGVADLLQLLQDREDSGALPVADDEA